MDPEIVIGDHLRADPSVAALAAGRVGTRTPLATGEPWVRLIMLDDLPDPRSRALHLAGVLIQCDCYGSDHADLAQGEAADLSVAVRAALHRMPAAQHAGAVVTAVRHSGRSRIPDQDFSPARERYVLTAEVTMHPEGP